ncbi:hypothetical protein LTR94_028650, partial [Friedmanniomyces endolithicus]
MTLTVRQFPCLSDNYGFLIRDEATGLVAAVDTPDAEAILADLEASGWGRLDLILNTHWHPDHTGGNERLQAETGCEIAGPEEDALAFVGDVIFSLGCGRLFEGTPQQMWDSLNRIAAWPEATTLYCAHEYTASNARFALSLPDADEALKAHAEAIFAARERGE